MLIRDIKLAWTLNQLENMAKDYLTYRGMHLDETVNEIYYYGQTRVINRTITLPSRLSSSVINLGKYKKKTRKFKVPITI